MVNDFAWSAIDEIGSGNEGFVPKFEGHRVPTFVFSSPILLMCMRTGYKMCNANIFEK